jgi:hypothetical protein
LALEADGEAFASFAGWDFAGMVLLEHVSRASKFEPARAEFALVDPFLSLATAEAIDVKAEGGFHIRDPEERNYLLDVGCVSSALASRVGIAAPFRWRLFADDEGLPEFEAVAFSVSDPGKRP